MNGYFQLDCREDGTYLLIFAEKDGGEPIKVVELAEYLQRKGIVFDITDLNRKVTAIDDKGIIQLDSQKRYPEREMMTVTISADKMSAYARFYPASVGGVENTKDVILADLINANVKHGIDGEAIDRYLANKEYCKDILIASGTPVRHGSDAEITYFFNTDLKARPTLKEDGSVDFFNLNTMNHIKKGDLLARLTPEDKGESGITVTKEFVRPREVKRLVLKSGRNIIISEDKLEAFADVDGHVMLVDDKLFVSDIYQVQNVDNSTGNIEYEGSVQVAGNVCTNFSVHAKGNIEVMGVVEGATLIADGDIIIVRGVNGMGKGYLKAGGNIITKFIENATAIAGGYVETDAILHSKVMANGDIHVEGRKGMISGSVVAATNSIDVKVLGSQMGSDTVLELGINPERKLRFQNIMGEVDEIKKKIKQIEPVLVAANQKMSQGQKVSPERLQYIQNAALMYQQLRGEMEKLIKEYEELEDLINSNQTAVVRVKDIAYAGTKIAISDVSTILKSDVRFVKFYYEGGDVRYSSL